jgi:GT2 family glycosyltransferase
VRDNGLQFSIVVPTCGRPRQVRECVESLGRLDYPPEQFEVIVVDNGGPDSPGGPISTDGTSFAMQVVREVRPGPAAARNAGAARARGRYLAFTDDDCLPDSGWLKRLDARFRQTPHNMIGGRANNGCEGNVYAVANQVVLDVVYEFFNRDPDNARLLATNNMAVPTELFRAAGGFDPGFPRPGAEDRDFCDRWRHLGHELTYAPEVAVTHAHRLTLPGFCRRHFNYGRGAYRYHRLRRLRGSGRMRSDLRLHLALPGLLRWRMSSLGQRETLTIGALLLMWQLANAAGFFWEMGHALNERTK